MSQQAAAGIWGTPYYIAPEKVKRQKPDERSDIYSLGATYTTRWPASRRSRARRRSRWSRRGSGRRRRRFTRSAQTSTRTWSASWTDVQEEPSKRYPTYASLISDLRKVVQALAPKGGYSASTTIRSKKMIIKKRSAPRIRLDAPTSRPEADASATLDGYRRQATKTKSRRGCKKALIIMLTVFALLLVGGGVTVGVLFHTARRALLEAMRREALDLRNAVKKAEESYDIILSTADKTATVAAGTAGFIARTTNAGAGRAGCSPGPVAARPRATGEEATTDAAATNAPSTTPTRTPSRASRTAMRARRGRPGRGGRRG